MLNYLQEECKKYTNVVFKKCSDCIIVLQKPKSEFLCNEMRKDIYDPNFAKFRANRLFVKDIIHYKLKTHLSFLPHKNDCTKIVYMINSCAKADKFESNLEEICTNGIHYFLTLEAAFYYELKTIKTGTVYEYYSNGRLKNEFNFKQNKKDGFQFEFAQNGTLLTHSTYNKGKRHGIQIVVIENVKKETLYYYGEYIKRAQDNYFLT